MYKREQYPILGEPQRIFEDDSLFVINEIAEIGEKYTLVCPQCHTNFIGKTTSDKVQKIKCPDCDTIICISTQGKEGGPQRMRTQAISKTVIPTPPGILTWKEKAQVKHLLLTPGVIIIGRKDTDEPSDISLEDDTASRRSVRIEVIKGEQTGRYMFRLVVQRTTNAVYVNNNALYSQGSLYLNYGDTIRIGETSFTLIKDV